MPKTTRLRVTCPYCGTLGWSHRMALQTVPLLRWGFSTCCGRKGLPVTWLGDLRDILLHHEGPSRLGAVALVKLLRGRLKVVKEELDSLLALADPQEAAAEVRNEVAMVERLVVVNNRPSVQTRTHTAVNLPARRVTTHVTTNTVRQVKR